MLKLILNLRKLGNIEASESLRNKVRKALLHSEDDEAASTAVDNYCRRAEKNQNKLDGTLEKRRAEKRARREERTAHASQYVDMEAESGEETSSDKEKDE